MKKNIFSNKWIPIILILCFIFSCTQKMKNMPMPLEQESLYDALQMDTALHQLLIYHDSVVYAQSHAPTHIHHYDSLFHHHDSLYIHHHTYWHHGDTVHHHSGWHHTPSQHHQHDSLLMIHHTLVH